MRLSSYSTVVLASTTISAALAFVHQPGASDGLYLHHLDSAGKATNQYLGLKPKETKNIVGRSAGQSKYPLMVYDYDTEHIQHLHERPHASKRLEPPTLQDEASFQPSPSEDTLPVLFPRGADTNGPIGNEGPNCDPKEVSLNTTLIGQATTLLGQLCDSLGWWFYAVSAVAGDVVAYSCEYGNGNHCDDESVKAQNAAVDTYCLVNVSGWYSVENYKYATGRTMVGQQFCHRGLTSTPGQGQGPGESGN